MPAVLARKDLRGAHPGINESVLNTAGDRNIRNVPASDGHRTGHKTEAKVFGFVVLAKQQVRMRATVSQSVGSGRASHAYQMHCSARTQTIDVQFAYIKSNLLYVFGAVGVVEVVDVGCSVSLASASASAHVQRPNGCTVLHPSVCYYANWTVR